MTGPLSHHFSFVRRVSGAQKKQNLDPRGGQSSLGGDFNAGGRTPNAFFEKNLAQREDVGTKISAQRGRNLNAKLEFYVFWGILGLYMHKTGNKRAPQALFLQFYVHFS